MDPEQITYFAETDSRNKRVRFGIKAKDRTKHVYVIGKTGMGKSTLLENMIIQDVQNGEGVAMIDPHGASAEKVLDHIPEHRIEDVVYFAPFDLENPIAFNVMEDVGYDKRHLVVSGLMSAFRKVWIDAWSARMEYILTNTLLALLEYPDATLLGVNKMYTDKVFRKKVVENIKDPLVKSFWVDEFATYTDRYTQEATPAIQNKIGQFTGNPLIRNIIGQPKSTFNLRKVVDEKKIFICNLSKGRVGEVNANLLGSMLITKLYLAAMGRADVSERNLAKLPNFYFYVDEFQSFANESFADILSEARKYKLNLTMAHQYIEQMSDEVRAAVFGNVGSMLTFRVGAYDADVLEKEFAPQFYAQDLVNLGFTQIYLKLMIDGVGSPPFSATTLPPIEAPEISYKDHVIKASQETYGRPRAEVEEFISAWHAVKKPELTKKPQQSTDKKSSFSKDQKKNSKNNVSKFKSRPDIEESSHKGQLAEIARKMTKDKRRVENNRKSEQKERTRQDKAGLKAALSAVLGGQQNSKEKKKEPEIKAKTEEKVLERHEDKKETGSQQSKNATTVEQKEIPEGELRKVLDVEGEK